MTKNDYYETLTTFSNSHRRVNDKGKKICWIDENLDPFTGEWISRKMLIAAGSQIKERGKDYNHSSFCDLVISGLLGLQPQALWNSSETKPRANAVTHGHQATIAVYREEVPITTGQETRTCITIH